MSFADVRRLGEPRGIDLNRTFLGPFETMSQHVGLVVIRDILSSVFNRILLLLTTELLLGCRLVLY